MPLLGAEPVEQLPLRPRRVAGGQPSGRCGVTTVTPGATAARASEAGPSVGTGSSKK